MSVRPNAGPLVWNVAGLLGEAPGAERSYPIDRVELPLAEDLRLAQPISGEIRLIRTNRGILAGAELHAALAMDCSRCLRDISVPVAVSFQEEFLPSLDLATGQPLDRSGEPEVARLTDHHELDLETPVREAISLAEPIAPLCRPDCPGLCVVCGGRLDEGGHDHPDDDVDPRLEGLRAFRVREG